MTLGVWNRLTQISVQGPRDICSPSISVFSLHPPCEPRRCFSSSVSPHLSLKPPGGKVAGKLDENTSPCLTSMLSLWKTLPDWLSRGLRSCPPFLGGQDVPRLTSLAPSSTPMLLLPHPGHVPSQAARKLLKCPLHMVCFEQAVWSHQREISFS